MATIPQTEQLTQQKYVLIIADAMTDQAQHIPFTLQSYGLQVEQASSSTSALAAVRRNPPAAIVLDADAPIIDGSWFCSLLKADPATASIPVIMLSTMYEARTALNAFEAGAHDFIANDLYVGDTLLESLRSLRVS